MKLQRIYIVALSILLCLVFLTTGLSSGQTSESSTLVHSTGIVRIGSADYSYTVSKDGTYTVLSGNDEEITRNTDAITIINQAITLASSISGSVLIQSESYSLTSNINMQSNVIVYLELGVTLTVTSFSPSSRTGVVNFNSITNAHFVTATDPQNENAYPKVIGKGSSNNECGVYLRYTTYSSVGKIEFSNVGGYGFYLYYGDYNTFDGSYFHGTNKVSGSNHDGGTIRPGSYNKFLNIHIDAEHSSNNEEALSVGGGGSVPITGNEFRGGIFEGAGSSHAIYCYSESGAPVDGNLFVGGISRGCRGSNYACGFKINTGINNRVGIELNGTVNPWLIYDCSAGIEMGDGGYTGNHGNLVYAVIRNCRKGGESWLQSTTNVENNEYHLDVDVDLVNYPATGGVGYTGFDFGGFQSSGNGFIQNNVYYIKVRNCEYGIGFCGWDSPQTATREARYNTFYLDVDSISKHAIWWESSSGGYGRWNTFYGSWKSDLLGNCGSIPNGTYVYTDNTAWITNIATNTFNPA